MAQSRQAASIIAVLLSVSEHPFGTTLGTYTLILLLPLRDPSPYRAPRFCFGRLQVDNVLDHSLCKTSESQFSQGSGKPESEIKKADSEESAHIMVSWLRLLR